jgi:putative hydrolase of the HAD superfamily
MPLKLVLFDLWGTLILDAGGASRDELRARMTRDALMTLGIDVEVTHVESAFREASMELSKVHAGGLDISAEARTVLFLTHIDPALPARIADDAWPRLHQAVLTTALYVRPPIIEGAQDALAAVAARQLPLALVSNAGTTPGFVLRQVLDDAGLLQYFAHTTFSDEVELSKPTAAIFELTLDEFGVEPNDAVFIGDQPVLDVLGPQAAGLWTIQVGDIAEDGIEPHIRIPTLADLDRALDEVDSLIAASPSATR